MRARWLVVCLGLTGCDGCGKQYVDRDERLPAPAQCAAPPSDAVPMASGARYVLLKMGHGEYRPRGADEVRVTVNAWTTDGTHFLSMTDQLLAPSGTVGLTGPMALAARVATLMTEGEKRRFWGHTRMLTPLPELEWPESDICVDMEIISINRDLSERPPPQLPPELRAPPADAHSTPDGIRYVFLARGDGDRHPAATELTEFIASAWYLGGHLEGQQLAQDRLVRATPLDAPGEATATLLMLMREGDRIRAWVPAGLGVPARRGPPDVPMVAELKLTRIF